MEKSQKKLKPKIYLNIEAFSRLEETLGNKTEEETAEMLYITRTTLWKAKNGKPCGDMINGFMYAFPQFEVNKFFFAKV